MKTMLLVGLGGFLGSIARFSLGQYFGKLSVFGASFPATFLANLLGCFLIGVLMGLADKFSKEQLLFATTGFCGGFTTFSTFSFESLQFLQKGDYRTALLYMMASLFLGLLFTFIGFWLAKNV